MTASVKTLRALECLCEFVRVCARLCLYVLFVCVVLNALLSNILLLVFH